MIIYEIVRFQGLNLVVQQEVEFSYNRSMDRWTFKLCFCCEFDSIRFDSLVYYNNKNNNNNEKNSQHDQYSLKIDDSTTTTTTKRKKNQIKLLKEK